MDRISSESSHPRAIYSHIRCMHVIVPRKHHDTTTTGSVVVWCAAFKPALLLCWIMINRRLVAPRKGASQLLSEGSSYLFGSTFQFMGKEHFVPFLVMEYFGIRLENIPDLSRVCLFIDTIDI